MRLSFVLLVLVVGQLSSANSEVTQLLDSYVVASADAHLMQMKDDEIKKTPFTIQIASYMNERDAVAHVNELKHKEKSIFYYPSFVRGQIWFKVCVGQFSDKATADEYRKSFVKKFDEPFAVVVSLLNAPQSKNEKERMPANAEAKKVDQKIKADSKDERQSTSSVEPKSVAPSVNPVAPAKAPAAAEIKAQVAASTKPLSSGYSVQIAAYNDEKSVREAQEAIIKKGHPAFYQTALIQGKTWYRLFVGQFESKEEAQKFLDSLDSSIKKKDSFVRSMKSK